MTDTPMSAEELAKAEDWEIIRYCGVDAKRWTDALYAKFPDTGERVDYDTMLTWFANAIETGSDIRVRQVEAVARWETIEEVLAWTDWASYPELINGLQKALSEKPQ